MTDVLVGGSKGRADAGAGVRATSARDFNKDVIQPSAKLPVLVDFWAAWSEPCTQLRPELEQCVGQESGRIALVTLDIEAHPSIPKQLGVRSLPTVLAFFKGRPVDGFVGVRTGAQVRAFVNGVLDKTGDADRKRIAQAMKLGEDALVAGDAARAGEFFQSVRTREPGHRNAIGGLALVGIRLGELHRARLLLDQLDSSDAAAGEVCDRAPLAEQARAAYALALNREAAGDLSRVRQQAEANPGDSASCFELACAYEAQGDNASAMRTMLDIVRRDPDWNDSAARKRLLEWFSAWGPRDALAASGRRALSSFLFR